MGYYSVSLNFESVRMKSLASDWYINLPYKTFPLIGPIYIGTWSFDLKPKPWKFHLKYEQKATPKLALASMLEGKLRRARKR